MTIFGADILRDSRRTHHAYFMRYALAQNIQLNTKNKNRIQLQPVQSFAMANILICSFVSG